MYSRGLLPRYSRKISELLSQLKFCYEMYQNAALAEAVLTAKEQ